MPLKKTILDKDDFSPMQKWLRSGSLKPSSAASTSNISVNNQPKYEKAAPNIEVKDSGVSNANRIECFSHSDTKEDEDLNNNSANGVNRIECSFQSFTQNDEEEGTSPEIDDPNDNNVNRIGCSTQNDEEEGTNPEVGESNNNIGNGVNPIEVSAQNDESEVSNHEITAKFTMPKCIEKIGNGRKKVRCKLCFENLEMVTRSLNRESKQIPAICKSEGSQNRKNVIENHVGSQCHLAVVAAIKISSLSVAQRTSENTIERGISKQNQDLFIKICQQMLTVFNDAKRGTLSAWSWPSREMAIIKGQEGLKTKRFDRKFEPQRRQLQYLTPTHHAELLDYIVEVDKPNLKTKIKNALAVSMRLDGSVDRTQIHNIHVMLNLIEEDGESSLVFLGFGEPDGHNNADEYYKSVKKGAEKTITWDELFVLLSSIATDGENLNFGEKGGLWALMDRDRRIKDLLPLIKLWCAVHRENLAWKAVTKTIPEVLELIEKASSLCSHFHASAVRTKILENIAKENGLQYVHFPSYHEVRWTEFSNQMLEAIMKNWRAAMLYFIKEKQSILKDVWLNKDRIHLTCVLSDISFIYKWFQKSCESDDMTVFDIDPKKQKLIVSLTDILSKPLAGGWEETFLDNVFETESYFGAELQKFNGHNLIWKVKLQQANPREVSQIKTEVISKLIQFLNERFEVDHNFRDSVQPLANLDPDIADVALRKCHRAVCEDFEFRSFRQEYFELACIEEYQQANPKQLLKILCRNKNDDFVSVKTALARIIAAKPHSADVERLINDYNKIKTDGRSSAGAATTHNNLYVKLNMKTLDSFDPTPAAMEWLTSKKHRDRPVVKSTEQEWFKGVFQEANDRAGTKKISRKVGF